MTFSSPNTISSLLLHWFRAYNNLQCPQWHAQAKLELVLEACDLCTITYIHGWLYNIPLRPLWHPVHSGLPHQITHQKSTKLDSIKSHDILTKEKRSVCKRAARLVVAKGEVLLKKKERNVCYIFINEKNVHVNNYYFFSYNLCRLYLEQFRLWVVLWFMLASYKFLLVLVVSYFCYFTLYLLVLFATYS